MKTLKKWALFIGIPVVTIATLLSVSPAGADGAREVKSITTSHRNGIDQTITCTLTFTIITHYQNNPKTTFASYDMSDKPNCLNATFYQSLTWKTGKGGDGQVLTRYGGASLIPKHQQDIYQPVNKTPGNAQFTETTSSQSSSYFSFDDCVSGDCTFSLTLTADGVT